MVLCTPSLWFFADKLPLATLVEPCISSRVNFHPQVPASWPPLFLLPWQRLLRLVVQGSPKSQNHRFGTVLSAWKVCWASEIYGLMIELAKIQFFRKCLGGFANGMCSKPLDKKSRMFRRWQGKPEYTFNFRSKKRKTKTSICSDLEFGVDYLLYAFFMHPRLIRYRSGIHLLSRSFQFQVAGT